MKSKKSRKYSKLQISVIFFVSVLFFSLFVGCSASSRSVIRMQKLEENVKSPTTVDEIKTAIKKYEKRAMDIELTQSQIGIWYKMLGSRYLDKKMYGEALKAFQKSIEFYPANPNLYYYIGLCAGYMAKSALDYNADGTTDKRYNYLKLSESAYLRAINLEPKDSRSLYGLSILYVFELGKSDQAIPYLEKLLSFDTKHTDAMFVLARAYYENRKFDKAVALYDKIIKTTASSNKKAEAEANKKKVLDASYAQK